MAGLECSVEQNLRISAEDFSTRLIHCHECEIGDRSALVSPTQSDDIGVGGEGVARPHLRDVASSERPDARMTEAVGEDGVRRGGSFVTPVVT